MKNTENKVSITSNGRSLRPECSVDAPGFLSAVYKRGTQAKKAQADALQHGRSMIEMLGVLAIIGVLSVGGIAGYSKALTRYKANKALQQISLIATNMQSFFGSQRDYGNFNTYFDTGKKIIQKAKIIPEEMMNWQDDTFEIESPVGIITLWDSTNDTGEKSFIIHISPFVEDEALCIEFVTKDWNSVDGFIGMGIASGDLDGSYGCTSQDKQFCSQDIPLSLDKAAEFCRADNDIIGYEGGDDGLNMKFK